MIERNKYLNICTEDNYKKLLSSGMFWEFYPELSGNWNDDKTIIDIVIADHPTNIGFKICNSNDN